METYSIVVESGQIGIVSILYKVLEWSLFLKSKCTCIVVFDHVSSGFFIVSNALSFGLRIDINFDIQAQHQDLEAELTKVQREKDKEAEDQKSQDLQRTQEYERFKQEKELEISNLKGTSQKCQETH